MKPFSTSIILSGSLNRGPFFGVTGQVPEECIKELGIENNKGLLKPIKEISDIDLLIVVDSLGKILNILDELISIGFGNESIKQRYKVFAELYDKQRVDLFSLRLNNKNIEQSLHFFIEDTFYSKIMPVSACDQDVVYDLRPNPPGSVAKYGGYPLINVGKDLGYKKTFSRDGTWYDTRNYINPLPRTTYNEDDGSIHLGIMTGYTAQDPIILHDTGCFMRSVIDEERRQITDLGGDISQLLIKLRGNRLPSYRTNPEFGYRDNSGSLG